MWAKIAVFNNFFKGKSRTETRIDEDTLYINSDQLNFKGTDFYKKIPSKCSDCQSNKSFKIWIQEIRAEGSHTTSGHETVYWMKCTNCHVSFEILQSVYVQIKPILKINEKLKMNNISHEKFLDLNDKYLHRIAKKNKLI